MQPIPLLPMSTSFPSSASVSTSTPVATVPNPNNTVVTDYLFHNLAPAADPAGYKAYMQARRDADPIFFRAKPAVRNPLTGRIVGHLVGTYALKPSKAVKAKPINPALLVAKPADTVTVNHRRSTGGLGSTRADGTEVLNYASIKTPHKGVDKGAFWNLGTSKKSRNKAANRARLNARIFTANRADRLSGCRTSSNGIGTGFNSRNTFSPWVKSSTATGISQFVRVYRCEAEPLATPLVLRQVDYPTAKPVETSYARKLSRRWAAERAAYKAERRSANRKAFTLAAVEGLLAKLPTAGKVARNNAAVAQSHASGALLATTVVTSIYTPQFGVRFATVFEDCVVEVLVRQLLNHYYPDQTMDHNQVLDIHSSLFGSAEPFGKDQPSEELLSQILQEHSDLLDSSKEQWTCGLSMTLRRGGASAAKSRRTTNRVNKTTTKQEDGMTPALTEAKAAWLATCKVKANASVEQKLEYACKVYNKAGRNASVSTFEGYLIKVYNAGALKPEFLVNEELAAQCKDLFDTGLKGYQVAEELGITQVEAYAAQQLINKETSVTNSRTRRRTAADTAADTGTRRTRATAPRRRRSTAQEETVTNRRTRATRIGAFKLLEAELSVDAPFNPNLHDLQPLFHISSAVGDTKPEDKWVMALVPFREDCTVCNVNLHHNVIPSNKKAKYEEYMHSLDNSVCKEIPVGYTPSAEYKGNQDDAKFRDKAPITFRPGRVHTYMLGKSGKKYLKWGDAIYMNFTGLDDLFGSRVSSYILFDSKEDGKTDLASRQAGSRSVGEVAAEVRAVIREGILNGTITDADAEFIAEHGNHTAEFFMGMNEAAANAGVPSIYDEEGERHYMLVIGHVSNVIDERRTSDDKVGGQYRLLCDDISAFYVPVDKVEEVCDLTRLSARNEYFTCLGDVQFGGEAEAEKEARTPSRRVRKPAAATAKATPAAPANPTTSEEEEPIVAIRKPHRSTVPAPAAQEVEPEAAPVTVEEKTNAILQDVSYSTELRALYAYSANPVEIVRNKDFWTKDEVISAFSVRASKAQKVEALSVLYPEVAEETLEALLSSGEKGSKWSKAQRVADAVRFYLYGHLSNSGQHENVDVKALPMLDYTWTMEDLEDVVEIIHALMAREKGTKKRLTRKGKESGIAQAIRLEGDGLFIDDRLAFTFDEDVVYDHRGRAFGNTLVMTQVVDPLNKKAKKVETVLANSFTNFMYFFYMAYLPLLANWKGNRGIFNNTFENLRAVLDGCGHLFKMTTDRVDNQNGGALHGLTSGYTPLVYDDLSPLRAVKDKKHNVILHSWFSLGSKAAKRLVKHYTEDANKKANVATEFADMLGSGQSFDSDSDLGSLINDAMLAAHSKYGLDFHFTKGQYIRGTLGHINLALVDRFCPTLMEALRQHLGSKIAAHKVIANTIKAAKGLKRVMLSLAQAAPVKDAKNAGWRLFDQKKPVEGALVKAVLAPTVVFAPGMAAWIGDEKDMPVAVVEKTIKYVRDDYELNDEGHPFDFTSSELIGLDGEGGSVVEWLTEEDTDGWNETFPAHKLWVTGKGNERIADIVGGEALYHQHAIEGELVSIRWQEQVSIDNKESELVIKYVIKTYEHHAKIRSIAKGQYFKTAATLLNNDINGDDFVDADLALFQDVIKSDTIYSWLMVAANCVAHNNSESPAFLSMVQEVIRINRSIVGHANLVDSRPQLVIEPTAVAAGVYDRLQDMFVNIYGKSAWFQWEDAASTGRMVYELYTNKVAAKKGWVKSSVAEFPTIANWATGRNVVVYREEGEVTNKTNVLAFALNNGEVVEYLQHGYVLAGTEELPLYNVELFESSTVKESISSSTQLISYIKALSAVTGDCPEVLEEQKGMLEDGRVAAMTAKLLSAAASGNTLLQMIKDGDPVASELRVMPIVGNDTCKFSADVAYDAAYNEMTEGLAQVGLDVDNLDVYGKGFFRKLAFACRNTVFTFATGGNEASEEPADKTALWLPGLYSLSRLTSKSDENRDFISMFVYDVLVPLIEERKVKAKVLTQVRGIMESFISSKNTVKFMNGRRNSGSKRITLPCIPCGETWVLYSNDTNSVYQQLVRDGIPVNDFEAVAKGLVVYGNRAPMPMGAITRMRIVMPVEVNGVIKQKLVPFENEVLEDKYLIHELSPVQIGVDPMSVNLDGGDYDGDGHFLTLLRILGLAHITSFDRVRELRSAAIGVDMFSAECGSYAADHYGIKSYAKATITLTDLRSAIVKSALKEAKEYVEYNRNAFTLQSKAVGVMYTVYMVAESIISLVNSAKKHGLDYPTSLEILTGKDSALLVLVLAEIYEIMLGGFDEAPLRLYNEYLEPVMKGEAFVELEDDSKGAESLDADALHIRNIRGILEDMGASSGHAAVLYTLLNVMREAVGINRNKMPGYDYIKHEDGTQEVDYTNLNLNNFIFLSLACFELGRGRFEGFSGALRDKGSSKKAKGHRNALNASFNFLETLRDSEAGLAMIDSNPLLFAFNTFTANLFDEMVGQTKPANIVWYSDEFDYFRNILGTVETITTEEVEAEVELDLEALGVAPVAVVEEAAPAPTEEEEVQQPAKPKRSATKTEAPVAAPVEEEEIEVAAPIKAASRRSQPQQVEEVAPIAAPLEEEGIEVAAPIKAAKRRAPKAEVAEEAPVAAPVEEEEIPLAYGLEQSVPVIPTQEEEVEVAQPIVKAVRPRYRNDVTKQEVVTDLALLLSQSGELNAHELLSRLQDIVNRQVETAEEVEAEAETVAPVEAPAPIQKASKPKAVAKARQAAKTEKTKAVKQDEPDNPMSLDNSAPLAAPVDEEDIPMAQPMAAPAKKATKPRMIRSSNPGNIEDAEVVNDEKAITVDQEGSFVGNLVKQLEACGSPGKESLIDKIRSLTNEQVIVLQEAIAGNHLCLTGEGGCGKSYTVDVVRDVFTFLRWDFVVVGSTGTSVMNVEGDATFNSMFGLGLGFNRSDNKHCSTLEDYRNLVTACRRSNFVKYAQTRFGKKRPMLIILDEVSMVDTRLLNVVVDALEKENAKVQWLLVGDPMQFLPVKGKLFFKDYSVRNGETQQKGDSILKRLDTTIINLKQNIRAQGDTELVAALNELRLGKRINKLFRERFLASRAVTAEQSAQMVHLYYNNSLVKKHNEAMTQRAIANGAKSKVYTAKIRTFTGSSSWYKKGEDGTTIFDPIAVSMTLCEGMPVMIRMNLKEGDSGNLYAANGTMGTVVALHEGKVEVMLRNGKIVNVFSQPLHAPKDAKGNPIGEFKQLPLHPAYAITMHKCQGLTFDRDIMIHAYCVSRTGEIAPLSFNCSNAFYVCCSRVTDRKYLHFATGLNHLEIEDGDEVDENSMWQMVRCSYHTDKDALQWVTSLS